MTLPLEEMIESFHRRYTVDPETGCWLWHGEMHKQGYGVLQIKRKGQRYRMLAHRFSLKHVKCVDIPDGHDACHECDNRPCVNPGHLFPGTRKDNMEDCVAKGRQARGGMLPQTKLTESQVQSIWSDRRTQEEIAEQYDITPSVVSDIKNGKEWSWLTASNDNEAYITPAGDLIAGERHYAAKLTERDVLAIRASDETDAALAARYRMSSFAIYSARTGMTWRRVPMPDGREPLPRPKVSRRHAA